MPMPNAMVATTMRRHDEDVNRSSILSFTDGCVDRVYMSIKRNCGKSGAPGGLVKFGLRSQKIVNGCYFIIRPAEDDSSSHGCPSLSYSVNKWT